MVFKLILLGSFTGKSSTGIFTISFFELYAIGIGHPQYLCLETPQSFSLKLIFFLPIFFSSSTSIVLVMDSDGAFNPFKNFELKSTPDSVKALFVIVKESP